MHSFYPFICILIYLISVSPEEMCAQTVSHVLESKKEPTTKTNSVKINKSTEHMLSPKYLRGHIQFDSEIESLTKQILSKPISSVGLRPFELRVDFIEELDRLQIDDTNSYISPSSLNPLIQPQPFTYNMAVAGWNRWWINPVEWIVVDVPDFYSSDYDL